jgi:hypothetical protein
VTSFDDVAGDEVNLGVGKPLAGNSAGFAYLPLSASKQRKGPGGSRGLGKCALEGARVVAYSATLLSVRIPAAACVPRG